MRLNNSFKTLLVASALGLWTSAATAHHIWGSVMCNDTIPATPVPGALITVQGGGTTIVDNSLVDGSFIISVPAVTDTYTVTIATPSGYTLVSPVGGQYSVALFADGIGGPNTFYDAHFVLSGCDNPPPPPPKLGSIGDTVYCDGNGNGMQDSGEAGIPGVKVTLLCKDENGATVASADAMTDMNGKYLFVNVPAGICEVYVDLGTVTGDCNVPVCATMVRYKLAEGENYLNADFCFTEQPSGPGTGTPGYWKTHATAWPVNSIVVGGRTYTKAQAIKLIGQAEKGDKTLTVFRHLVCAMLNVMIGNASACVESAIEDADAWMAIHPVGSKVSGSSAAWGEISATATKLDQYNNGMLCAPHRD